MKKVFTSLMLMLFAVLAVNAQSVVYTLDTSLEENKGTDNGYATAGDVTVDGITWNATGNITMAPWRIGGKSLTDVDRVVKTTTAYSNALTKVVLTLGDLVSGITVNSVSLSWADNADFDGAQTITKDYANEIEFAPETGFAANSYYKFAINVTVPGTSNKFVTFNKVEFYGAGAPATGWDGTITTSLDNAGTLTSWEAFEGFTIKFNGANSIVLDEDAYFAIEDTWAWGNEVYVVWTSDFGSEYTVNGDELTLTGFVDAAAYMAKGGDVKNLKKAGTIKKAAAEGETEYQLNIYGDGFIIDGNADWALGAYGNQIDLFFNYEKPNTPAAEPFMFTSVSNNGVEGSVVGVEASEDGVSFQFTVTATGKELNAGEVLPTLSMMENDTDFGQASVIAYGGEQAYVRFMAPEKYYFTEPGTYVLNIPEGAFVDAEGTPNAAVAVKWVVIQNDAPASIAIEGIEPAVALENEFGDVYYQTALNVKVPESFIGKYYYSEGLFLEGSTSPFMFDFDEELGCGIVESTDLRIVFTDTRKNREPGTYTATASIFFIDEDWETELGTATFTGSLVLPALGEAPKATITLVNGEYTTELYDGAPVAEATSLTITMPKEYAEAVCSVDKLVYDEEYDYTYEETQYGSLEKVDATTWTFTFDKQPQNFASGFKYQIKVRGWEGGMFDEDWNLNPYDETLIVVNGVGAEDAVELDMSFYEYQINGEDENYELLYSDFDGVTLRYPWNNVEEVYGEEDFFQWGAIMLKVVNAYMYECDENLGYDVEHPYAEEHNAMSSEYDEVTIFSNVTVEPNKQYMIVIPQRGIRLINMMEYGFDDDTMDGVLWTNSGEWDEIYVLLNPKSVTTGISNVSNEDNAPMFNLAGQRVNGNVKGIVIKNGKKILVK